MILKKKTNNGNQVKIDIWGDFWQLFWTRLEGQLLIFKLLRDIAIDSLG